MQKLIEERALVIPSLFVMQKNEGITTTTELQEELSKMLNPSGEDLDILKNRQDNKFSQKVRNLKSHNTFEILGYAEYINSEKGRTGHFKITDAGKKALNNNRDSLAYLTNNAFKYVDTLNELEKLTKPESKYQLFDENVYITEGETHYVGSNKYKRSKKLRTAAVEFYQNKNGNISCSICSFDFEKTYGYPGKEYIEMHHLKPISMFESEDMAKIINEAIENLVPVCANCHRVIHRKSPPYEISDLKEFYKNPV
ncbi:HNH endonuclease [Hyphomicrobiales bacterium]|jgi:predicted HNH restriction endonuclease|nr:HNH endonuclease [Hyphomicrobiales bacterium]